MATQFNTNNLPIIEQTTSDEGFNYLKVYFKVTESHSQY